MYSIYNILYALVLMFLLPYEYFRRPKLIRGRWLKERFGFPPASSGGDGAIWVHAVSVGEVIASISLIKRLKASFPGREVVLSTVTDTGQKVAEERAGRMARIIYIPFDLNFTVARTFSRVNPSLFIIMETELWPVIIHYFRRRGVPVLLMNGRLSEKSARGYRKLRFFFERVVGELSFSCMQDGVYADRIISIGASPDKVLATGNFKFDTRPPASMPDWTGMLARPVLIAGSTHRPEEDIVLDLFEQLVKDRPTLNLIIAPRHPERFGEVEELIKRRGLKYVKRSEMNSAEERTGGRAALVVLLDVMGELSSVYGAADIAIMGGSFIGHGGQNPLEPAFWGRPIICGPHMENFPFIDEFYRQGAAVSVDKDSLYSTVTAMLDSPQRSAGMGKAARYLYDRDAGATDRALEITKRFI